MILDIIRGVFLRLRHHEILVVLALVGNDAIGHAVGQIVVGHAVGQIVVHAISYANMINWALRASL